MRSKKAGLELAPSANFPYYNVLRAEVGALGGTARKVLPAAEYPIFDLPLDHPLFQAQFAVTEIPQIPNIRFFIRSGGQTSERGADSAIPYARGIADDQGWLMVPMTHNTDIQDSWEREGMPRRTSTPSVRAATRSGSTPFCTRSLTERACPHQTQRHSEESSADGTRPLTVD